VIDAGARGALTVARPPRGQRMGLDTSTVGFETEPVSFDYDWKTVALYALAVGATRDELDYLYEGRGPRVLPTFAVIPAYGPVSQLFVKTQCDMTRLVHGGQTLRLHRPLPAQGRLLTNGRIEGIYDMKKLAQVVLSTSKRCSTDSQATSIRSMPTLPLRWPLVSSKDRFFTGCALTASWAARSCSMRALAIPRASRVSACSSANRFGPGTCWSRRVSTWVAGATC
jgi:hypothetical protein